MEKKHQVHNLIILDESGSMESIKNTIIKGFNELVQTIHGIEKQFPEQEHFISFVTFNSLGTKFIHLVDPAGKLSQIDDRKYCPNACTPLFDAMGFALVTLKQALTDKSNYNVLVTVLTDGEENNSKEYSVNAIKAMVEELKQENWTFTYIGTDHDVEKIALSISITNTLKFSRSDEDIKQMFDIDKNARIKYSKNVSMFANFSDNDNYFDIE